MKNVLHSIAATCKLTIIGAFVVMFAVTAAKPALAWWEITAVDTMKYSRDRAREYASGDLDKDLDEQMKVIADTGATHVAIATPYDEEFAISMRKWVAVARKYNLKVWFRGNWSGWEQWFEHSPISREQHISKTKQYILNNSQLFEDGDIFTACPECENGGPGDPRQGDAAAHTKFLIDEHEMMMDAFKKINKDVLVNVNSMNGDVARLIMTKKTTAALGGLVAVDHYVETPEQLAEDISDYAKESGGMVFLGEMGAPIPDIHGSMTEKEQAEWLDDALMKLAKLDTVAGINYWTAWGGSTALWNSENEPKEAVAVLKKYFDPETIQGSIMSTTGKTVTSATITSQMRAVTSNKDGSFELPYLEKVGNLVITHPEYHDKVVSFAELQSGTQIVLEPKEVSAIERLKLWLTSLRQRFFNR